MDKFKDVNGYFTLQAIDKDGNVLDTIEGPNMIMETSKATMAQAIGGSNATQASNNIIGSLTLGTTGNAPGDIFTPKLFDYERTALFSQNGDDGTSASGTGDFWMVDFNITSGSLVVENCGYFVWQGTNIVPVDDTIIEDCTITMNVTGSDAVFSFDIPIGTANKSANEAVAYTEASLCTCRNKDFSGGASGDIFAMRTFPGKIKDDTTKFLITWKITF